MKGERFEKQLFQFFQRKGFEVSQTPKTNDKGIDLLLKRGGHTIAVQAKAYAEDNKVDSSAIQKASGLLARDDIHDVIVITTSSFTTPAREVAKNRDVELMSVSIEQHQSTNRRYTSKSRSTGTQASRSTTSTSRSDPVSYSDRTTEAEEYTCPSCGETMKRTGWSPYYHHFKDCELPDEKPGQLSEDQWTKVKERLEQPENDNDDQEPRSTALNHITKTNATQENSSNSSSSKNTDSRSGAEEYTCPNCGKTMQRTGWFPYYHHFRDCELPEEKPEQLSDGQWTKVRGKIAETNNKNASVSTKSDREDNMNSNSSRCPSCGSELAADIPKLLSHYEDCELPEKKPVGLHEVQWNKIQGRVNENDSTYDASSSNTSSQHSIVSENEDTSTEKTTGSHGFFDRLRSLL